MIYRIDFNRAAYFADGVQHLLIYEWFLTKMSEAGLRPPKRVNPKARFWFTELGWEKVGKSIAEDLRKHGVYVRILRRKRPKEGDVYWADPYQVALLPDRKY